MNTYIRSIRALEILDSRGTPTLRVYVTLQDGSCGIASVPSGASTGANEALELRDGDAKRFGGKGVRQAVANVNGEISQHLVGLDAADQAAVDKTLIALDGTANKGRLGANATVGVSMAVARAAAAARGLPLYRHLGGPGACALPMPMMNVINGGKHADSGLEFQEFMIVPLGANRFSEAVRFGAETFQALKSILKERSQSIAVGDEGGFAPRLGSNREACELIVNAIERAGYRPGSDIAIALDPAASSFYVNGRYEFPSENASRPTSAMQELYKDLVKQFPIVSIEDGFAEDDWEGFRQQTATLGDELQIVGDDLLVTNPIYIRRAIQEKACNAVLIKLNQIGTVTETIEAIELCRSAHWRFVISHRSGETEDPFIADFAVAMGGGQIKTGSLCRSERIAKYNRLIEIESELQGAATFEWNGPRR